MLPATTLIYEGKIEFGAHLVYSSTPIDYVGPTRVVCYNTDRTIAVLPNKAEAERVGRYAVSPDGGWSAVELRNADHKEITHITLEEWI